MTTRSPNIYTTQKLPETKVNYYQKQERIPVTDYVPVVTDYVPRTTASTATAVIFKNNNNYNEVQSESGSVSVSPSSKISNLNIKDYSLKDLIGHLRNRENDNSITSLLPDSTVPPSTTLPIWSTTPYNDMADVYKGINPLDPTVGELSSENLIPNVNDLELMRNQANLLNPYYLQPGETQYLQHQKNPQDHQSDCLHGGTDCKDTTTKDPAFPNMKLVIESSWDADLAGGYLAVLWVPIYDDVIDDPNWKIRMIFKEPIASAKNWQFEPSYQKSRDNRTLEFWPKYESNLKKNTMLRMRFMLEYSKNEEHRKIKNYQPKPIVHFQDRTFDFNEQKNLGPDGKKLPDGIIIDNGFEKSRNKKLPSFAANHTELEKQANSKIIQNNRRKKDTICWKQQDLDNLRCTGLKASCFITQCTLDGQFIFHQCWPRLKICWCVDHLGKKQIKTLKNQKYFDNKTCLPKSQFSVTQEIEKRIEEMNEPIIKKKAENEVLKSRLNSLVSRLNRINSY